MMRRTQFYSSKHGPQLQRCAMANPLAKSIAVRRIKQHLRDIQTLAYMLADGEESAKVLAHMAWIIGLGAEVAFATQHPRARVLHGALRTVHSMALSGYRWRHDHAPAVDQALDDSSKLITTHADIAWTMLAGAEWIAHRISTRTTTAADIAGAELYAAVPEPISPAPEKIRALAPAAREGEGARQKACVKKDQQAAARPESAEAGARQAGTREVMDEGQAAGAACLTVSSSAPEGTC